MGCEQLDLLGKLRDGSDLPAIVFVDNGCICDGIDTTAHRVLSAAERDVVCWQGIFYDNLSNFAEDYVDYYYGPEESDEGALSRRAERLWNEKAIRCLAIHTTGLATIRECEVD